MIPDFVSAIYLWITDKISGPYPVWRSWVVPVCLFILFVGLSVVLVRDGETIEHEQSPTTTIEYVIEIEALKARCSAAETNILALVGTVNRLVVAINRIEPPPSLGNLATKREMELLRLEVRALKKELTRITNIYGHYSETFDSKLDEMRLNVEELEERLTVHTGNKTIHE